MEFEISIGKVGFGHMDRRDGRPGWFTEKRGAYAIIGPGSTGPFWKALRALLLWWPKF